MCSIRNESRSIHGLQRHNQAETKRISNEYAGSKVHPVKSGSKTLKDAINEAIRDWITNVETTYYLLGSAVGPHPYPVMVRDFQSVIGNEIKSQMKKLNKTPDSVIACVGGGSNAIGTFYPLVDSNAEIIGVELQVTD